ncbi:hydroxymethylglutaryl-CoA synthase 1 [Danaus plexippus]|uniref:Hydroxymethylglutaryl-CoA synthase n=1 Tax=Danaus plexippus plexippus TaxID=278856 RepID=A0A212FA99_DANPL|nr:hydroxymethylglutaryl-CoA synthase 1 [Danaus plexippus]OWR50639.1 3-hydroxy-3-methylglutaryl-CoA synthase [Danaus plexippus plexippus]
MANRVENVGILAMEIYIPSQYVAQEELEKFDGVDTGKYTIGLGQSKMGFCSDREDINSICMTALHRLIENNNINLHDIGRLEVGTETIIDKSKSVKTFLMTLFAKEGATDIEGIDTTNACYGGTAALFNTINWVESSSWDGRKAIVVAGDIAVYGKGPARPTGGAGAVAMLIGPDAPLVFDCGVRASYMTHAYDFYKPDLASEFPYVDGKLSIQCYLNALDKCYNLFCDKMKKVNPDFKGLLSLDGMLFHSPYCKLVQKSLARVSFNDFLNCAEDDREKQFPGLSQFSKHQRSETYFDRDLEKAFMAYSKDLFEEKTKPSLYIARNVGNMYTASLYGGLVSYLISKSPEQLIGKKFALFSYGSGLASTMYSVNICNDMSAGSKLEKLINSLHNNVAMLDKRINVEPQAFSDSMQIRTENYHTAPYEPSGSIDILFPGTYYLVKIDDQRRRTYDRKL